MKIDLSKYPPGTKFKLRNGKLAMLVGESPYRKGIYIIEYGDKGGHVDFSSRDGYIIFQDLYIESVIQPDKYLVFYLTKSKEFKTETILAPSVLTAETFLNAIILLNSPKWECFGDDSEYPVKILSWSKIEE